MYDISVFLLTVFFHVWHLLNENNLSLTKTWRLYLYFIVMSAFRYVSLSSVNIICFLSFVRQCKRNVWNTYVYDSLENFPKSMIHANTLSIWLFTRDTYLLRVKRICASSKITQLKQFGLKRLHILHMLHLNSLWKIRYISFYRY